MSAALDVLGYLPAPAGRFNRGAADMLEGQMLAIGACSSIAVFEVRAPRSSSSALRWGTAYERGAAGPLAGGRQSTTGGSRARRGARRVAAAWGDRAARPFVSTAVLAWRRHAHAQRRRQRHHRQRLSPPVDSRVRPRELRYPHAPSHRSNPPPLRRPPQLPRLQTACMLHGGHRGAAVTAVKWDPEPHSRDLSTAGHVR